MDLITLPSNRKPTITIDTENERLKQISCEIISPVLISFVWWVLTKARKSGLKKLYFLARDGYIMYKIAKIFCVRFDLNIECRYLYGSRLAWRAALYHLIGGEKYERIFCGGYMLTPRVILKRVQANREQRHKIYCDINNNTDTYIFDLSNENEILNDESMRIFSEKLKNSRAFNEYLDYTSQNQFKKVSMYLYQEDVFDGSDITLVDSGWTGSIQRTLRQIAEFNGIKPNITGYYFGLYEQSNDIRDGNYEAWYFSPKSPVKLMTNFNNNVLECMCASPFGMTIGYEYSENSGMYKPVLGDNGINFENARQLNEYIETYTVDFLNDRNIKFEGYSDVYLEKCRKVLQRFMMNPTKEEAETIGQFKFCDDASEAYENSLARFTDEKYLKNYTVLNRILNKKFRRKIVQTTEPDLFWFHGSLVFSGIPHRGWYRFNYILWETLRHLKIKYRQKH